MIHYEYFCLIFINSMKAKIHPDYNDKTKVTCACGNTFATGSTVKEINVEICHLCHPFYTGKSKVVDTAGRVDRFKRLQAQKETVSQERKGKKVKKAKKAANKKEKESK